MHSKQFGLVSGFKSSHTSTAVLCVCEQQHWLWRYCANAQARHSHRLSSIEFMQFLCDMTITISM